MKAKKLDEIAILRVELVKKYKKNLKAITHVGGEKNQIPEKATQTNDQPTK